MEEKERYELIGYCSYRDTETGVVGDNFVELLNQQDKEIKELEHRLSNCIEPKFKVGDKCWYYHIGRNKIYSGVVEDIQWRPVNGMYYRIPNLQRDYFWIRDDELFATEEEAKAKLEELNK